MNRAQHRAMKKAQQRNQRRAQRAQKRALPRCPVCTNEVSESDRVPCEGGNVLHAACVERVAQAKAIQTAERVKQQGIWLPGDK
jgi:hypothetical protein